eukprot:scaffold143716_cov18-Tisochrysis_lutea.AAC.1
MLVCLLACRFSYLLLLYCTQLSSKRSYDDLTEQVGGRVRACVFLVCRFCNRKEELKDQNFQHKWSLKIVQAPGLSHEWCTCPNVLVCWA